MLGAKSNSRSSWYNSIKMKIAETFPSNKFLKPHKPEARSGFVQSQSAFSFRKHDAERDGS